MFIAHLSINSYAPNTIITYTSEVSQQARLQYGINLANHFVIKKLLKAVRKQTKPDTRLPVTAAILGSIIAATTHVCSSNYEAVLFSSMFSLAYFALLRVSELTAVGGSKSSSLKPTHIEVARKRIIITISKSKSDQYAKSVKLQLNAKPRSDICVYRLIKRYIRIRSTSQKAFFIHADGRPVSDRQFGAVLNICLEYARIPGAGRFSSHSFRIGACTALADQGVNEDAIKQAGRWR